jgi:hypothetical protein
MAPLTELASNERAGSAPGRAPRKVRRRITVTLAAAAVAALAGCANPLHHATAASAAQPAAGRQAAVEKASVTAREKVALACAGQDAVATATLPLPPVDASSWKTMIAAYAAAGTSLAGDGTISAVPQLEAGSSALAAFSTTVAKCAAAES